MVELATLKEGANNITSQVHGAEAPTALSILPGKAANAYLESRRSRDNTSSFWIVLNVE